MLSGEILGGCGVFYLVSGGILFRKTLTITFPHVILYIQQYKTKDIMQTPTSLCLTDACIFILKRKEVT